MDSACGRPTADSSRGGRMDATFPAVPGVLGTCRWQNLPSGQRHVDHRGVPVSASRPRTRAPAGEAELAGAAGPEVMTMGVGPEVTRTAVGPETGRGTAPARTHGASRSRRWSWRSRLVPSGVAPSPLPPERNAPRGRSDSAGYRLSSADYDENVDSDSSDFSLDIIILPGQSLEWRPCVAMVWLPGPGSNELPAPRARTQGLCPKTSWLYPEPAAWFSSPVHIEPLGYPNWPGLTSGAKGRGYAARSDPIRNGGRLQPAPGACVDGVWTGGTSPGEDGQATVKSDDTFFWGHR